MPLGKLSKKQIQSAYSVLTELQQVGGFNCINLIDYPSQEEFHNNFQSTCK